MRWLDEGPEANDKEVRRLLERAGDRDAQLGWQASQNREERQRSSVYTTAEMIVSAYADERVKRHTRDAEYAPEQLLDGGKNTLYLAPHTGAGASGPLFAMPVQELLSLAYRLAALQNCPLDPPLLLLGGEHRALPDLDKAASTAAGQGIQLMTVFQDMAQIMSVYGTKAETIFNNHRAKMIGVGITDIETHKRVTHAAGVGEFEQRSYATGEKHSRTLTRSKAYRDLAPANVLREQDPRVSGANISQPASGGNPSEALVQERLSGRRAFFCIGINNGLPLPVHAGYMPDTCI